jgi:hypothetical protein
MFVRLHELVLVCRESREVVAFSPQITVVHGEISTGKSSVARLIDYCLGGGLERTPALRQELVSVSLEAQVGRHHVLFERLAAGSEQVQISWRGEGGQGGTLLAPIEAGTSPVFGPDVHNVSDMILHLLGAPPLRVRRNKRDPDAPLVRLSFRDIMWYCYLKQHDMDSSFFELEVRYRLAKSRDVVRLALGYLSERLNTLEASLEAVVDEQRGKVAAAKQIRSFLADHGLGTVEDITLRMKATEDELAVAQAQHEDVRQSHRAESHGADELRHELRILSEDLGREEAALADLAERIAQQEALQAELLSAKFKVQRSATAAAVLADAPFVLCPACGTRLDDSAERATGACRLCGRVPDGSTRPEELPPPDVVQRDLTSRVDELQDSIDRHRHSERQQQRAVDALRSRKAALDARLTAELAVYDSAYLARFRDVEARVAALQERLASFKSMAQLPAAVSRLESEAQSMDKDIARLREEVKAERHRLSGAQQHVKEVEDAYLEALLAVGTPGIDPGDRVTLNTVTWIPAILQRGEEDLAWDFFDAGSGGKKTLLKVCYALAFHRVAAQNDLPLPNLLIVDSPMKNISPDVNRDKFLAFYGYLYHLARGPLADTQFLIIDSDPPEASADGLDVRQRRMTTSDPDYPPLISYYRGP